MTQTGDLVYFPAGTELFQFNKDIENLDLDPEKTYVGPSPIKYKKLDKPANLLILDDQLKDPKVWFEGEEWHIRK